MNVEQIRSIAKQQGLKPGKQTKAALIRMIQRAEGNFDCFGTAVAGECDQLHCLWRQDCLSDTRRNH